jgi:hypothetical protein
MASTIGEGSSSARNSSPDIRLYEIPRISRSLSATSLPTAKSSVKQITKVFYRQEKDKRESNNKLVSTRTATSVSRHLYRLPTSISINSVSSHQCTHQCKEDGMLVSDVDEETWICQHSQSLHVCNEQMCQFLVVDASDKKYCSLTDRVFDPGNISVDDALETIKRIGDNVDEIRKKLNKPRKRTARTENDSVFIHRGIDKDSFRLSAFYPDLTGTSAATFRRRLDYIIYKKCSIPKSSYSYAQMESLVIQATYTWHWIVWTPLYIDPIHKYSEIGYDEFYHALVVLFIVVKSHDLVYHRVGGSFTLLRRDPILQQLLPDEKQLKNLLKNVVTVETSESSYQSGKSDSSKSYLSGSKKSDNIQYSLDSSKLKTARNLFLNVLTDFVRICPDEYLD